MGTPMAEPHDSSAALLPLTVWAPQAATLEAVVFFQVSYSGDPMTDVYGAQ